MIVRFLAAVGRFALSACRTLGGETLFVLRLLKTAATPPWSLSLIGEQAFRLGYLSLPVVGLTAFFTGSVMAIQIHGGSRSVDAEILVPSVVALGMVSQLGPVLTGLMMAGRVSAAIAAEISSMRVSEQIDALQTMSVDPLRHLAAPRLVATFLALPPLVAVADLIGLFGGWGVGVFLYDLNAATYLQNTRNAVGIGDLASALVKSLVFAAIIAVCGCRRGFFCSGGASGVGKAATHAAVDASILILAANYLISALFFSDLQR